MNTITNVLTIWVPIVIRAYWHNF